MFSLAYSNVNFYALNYFIFLKGETLLKPILDAGGTDISHWFDAKTKEVSIYNQG